MLYYCFKYSDTYLSANFIAMVDNLNQKPFAIVEFLNEDSCTEVVPSKWIRVDHILKLFICRWPGSINATRFTALQKLPTDSWEEFDCIHRKFCGL